MKREFLPSCGSVLLYISPQGPHFDGTISVPKNRDVPKKLFFGSGCNIAVQLCFT
jgi:hypothetical protein